MGWPIEGIIGSQSDTYQSEYPRTSKNICLGYKSRRIIFNNLLAVSYHDTFVRVTNVTKVALKLSLPTNCSRRLATTPSEQSFHTFSTGFLSMKAPRLTLLAALSF